MISEKPQVPSGLPDSSLASDSRYQCILDSLSDVVFSLNHDGQFIMLNQAWQQLTGFDTTQMPGKWLSDFIATNDYQRLFCDQHQNPVHDHCQLRTHEGTYLTCCLTLLRNDDGWHGCLKPDRESNDHFKYSSHTEKHNQASWQRVDELNAIISNSPDGIVTVSEEGLIVSANSTFLAMTGFDINKLLGLKEETLEQSLAEICETQPRFKVRQDGMMSLYPIDLHKLHSHRLHDNHECPAAPSSIRRVLSRTKRPLHQYGIAKVLYFRDISAESEIEQMKSQFLSTAAHELRTPMASVFGFSELLLARDFDSDTRQEILTTIHQQSKSLVNMLTQLLDLARIESRKGLDFCFERQALWPIVERVLSELLVPGDHRTIKFTKPKKNFHVEVDADKLRQVISNVLVNAYKYSPNGGEISLSIKQRKTAQGDFDVGIIISDQGLGMSSDQLNNIYDRFWRADNHPDIPGTGLGMSLVKEIMDIHQGQITIDSKLGKGTRVSLWLKQKTDLD